MVYNKNNGGRVLNATGVVSEHEFLVQTTANDYGD